MLSTMRGFMKKRNEVEREILKRRSDVIQNMLMRGVMPREVSNMTGVPLDYVRRVNYDICTNHF